MSNVTKKRLNIIATAITVMAMIVPFSFGNVQIAQAAGVSVTGRIVDPNGNALPVNNAGGWAQLDPTQGGPGMGAPIFNDTGTFVISNVSTGQWQLSVYYGGTLDYVGPAPQIFTAGSSDANLGDIRLAAPQVSGKAYAPNGTTVLTDTQVDLQKSDYTVNRGIRTGEDGSFKFGGLTAGTYNVMVRPEASTGYTEGKLTVTLATNSSTATGLQVIASTPNVIGAVQTPDGSVLSFNPEDGWVNVDIFNQDRTFQSHGNASPVDGSFSFGGVPAGNYTIEARAERLPYTNAVPKNVTVAASGVTNAGNIRLTTAKLTGTVTDPAGTPVANANIQVHNQDWSAQSWAQSGPDGSYRVGGLANGTYMVELQPPWNMTSLVAPEPREVTLTNSAQTLNLQFVAATKFLAGTVTRSDGQPITSARVDAWKEGGFGNSSTTVGANGSFQMSLSGGTWNVMVRPESGPGGETEVDWIFSGQPQRVTFANNSTVENQTVNLSVTPTNARVIGRLALPNGSPVTNANVDLRTQDGQGNNTQVRADGSFTLRVIAGSYRLNVWTPDQSMLFPEMTITVGEGQTKDVGVITASAKNARIIVKTVKENGTPIQGLRVNAFRHSGPGWSNSTTGEDGVATLAVTEGRWGVNIEAGQDAHYVRAGGPPVDVDIPTSDSTVSYANDARLLIEMEYADATITGNVVDSNGNVVTGFCGYAFARPNSGTVGDFGFQEFGGPVDCQQGSYTIYVPSSLASTFVLGVHTPPNSQYSPAGDQNVAVFADTTTRKDIVMLQNDAELRGRLIDQNGQPVSSCGSQENMGPRGWLDVSDFERGLWFGSEIRSDCTYSANLLSGDGYTMNAWMGEGGQFLNRPPSHETFAVVPGLNERNFTVTKADRVITGRVTDPDGNGVDAFVFAHTFQEFEGPPTEKEMENEMFNGTKTGPDGSFRLGVTSGVWEVGGGLPPNITNLLPPKFQRVDMRNQTEAVVDLSLQRALGQMSGQVRYGGSVMPFGFVACWDDTNGTFSGAPVENGRYALNYAAGTFTCQADSFNGNQLFRSDELTITFTDQTSVAQDFELTLSNFEVPEPVSATFDAGSAQVLTFENGTSINIPAGALGESGSNVTVTATPTVSLRKTKSVKPFGTGYDFSAIDSSGNAITSFNQNVTVKFTYQDEQLEEFGLSEASLTSQFYSEETGSWQSPNSVAINTETNEITITTSHFTTFAIVGAGAGGAGGPQTIVITPKNGGGPQVTTWDSTGTRQSSFMAYLPSFRGGVTTLMTDLDADGTDEIVTAPYTAGGPQVRVFDQDGNAQASLFPFPTSFRGGLSLAAGDVDGDGANELIVAPRTGGGPQVRVFDYANGTLTLHRQFFAYPTGLRTGINVQAGDTDGDGKAEIVTTANAGAAPHVRVFNGDTGSVEGQFFAYATSFRGGVNATVADVNADGAADIVVTAQTNGGPHVRVMRPDGTVVRQFFAYPASWRIGIKTAVGDVNGDGQTDIVTAPQAGGPHIRVFTNGTMQSQFMAYTAAFRGGVELAVADVDADGTDEIVTGPKVNGGPHVRILNSQGTAEANIMALHPAFRGGVNVTVSQ